MKILIILLFIAGSIFLLMAFMMPSPTSVTIPSEILEGQPPTSEIAITIPTESFAFFYNGEDLVIKGEEGSLTLYPYEFEDQSSFDLFFENWTELNSDKYLEPGDCNFIEVRLNNIQERKAHLTCFENINE